MPVTRLTKWLAPALAAVLAALPAGAGDVPQGTLYEDPVAHRVGDIVIVHLDVAKLGATISGQSSTTMNSSLISLLSQQGLTTSRGSTTAWQHALSGDLAMTVVEVTPVGLFHVRGARRVQVDGSWQTITIDGLLRPQDLASDDPAPGARLADVVATVNGHLTTSQRFSLWDALALIFGAGVLLKLIP
jgi:flagellar basal body L-ring protein FlgH